MHCILDHEDLDSVVLRSAVLEVALIAIREFQFKIVPGTTGMFLSLTAMPARAKLYISINVILSSDFIYFSVRNSFQFE